jgi:hypothetical protein
MAPYKHVAKRTLLVSTVRLALLRIHHQAVRESGKIEMLVFNGLAPLRGYLESYSVCEHTLLYVSTNNQDAWGLRRCKAVVRVTSVSAVSSRVGDRNVESS